MDQRIAECVHAAEKAKAAAEETKREAASTRWCPMENRYVPNSFRGVCTEDEAFAEYEIETKCYESPDPDACFRSS